MMFDVQISEQADRDLRGIFEYIAFELLAPENAAGQLDRLEDAISKLDNMPEKFRRYAIHNMKNKGCNMNRDL
jgi:plasmid stabilization system protein ParE